MLQLSDETLLLFSEVYADPNHSSYEALEFVSGVLTTFTPKVCKINRVLYQHNSAYYNRFKDEVFMKI